MSSQEKYYAIGRQSTVKCMSQSIIHVAGLAHCITACLPLEERGGRQFRDLHIGLFHTPEYPRNLCVEFCTEEPLKERGAGSLEIFTLGYFIHTPEYSSLALFQRDILEFPRV